MSAATRTRRARSSCSSILASPPKLSAIGPILTAAVPRNVRGSTTSVSRAPGMQGTMRGTSVSSAQARSTGAGTAKLVSICMMARISVAPTGFNPSGFDAMTGEPSPAPLAASA